MQEKLQGDSAKRNPAGELLNLKKVFAPNGLAAFEARGAALQRSINSLFGNIKQRTKGKSHGGQN